MLKPPEKPPYKGNPSLSIIVYRPSSPCIRIPAFPDTADVCCVCIPVLSVSSIRILPGCITAFSCSSPAVIVSTRVGMSRKLRLLRVAVISTSSSSSCWPVSSSLFRVSTGCWEYTDKQKDINMKKPIAYFIRTKKPRQNRGL